MARHRASIDGSPIDTPPDDITVSAGEPAPDLPRFLAPELARKGPAVRLRHTVPLGDTAGLRPRVNLALTLGPTGSRTQSLEGSRLALPVGPGELYASVERRHWGPAWSGSLILDGAAPPIAALGWRKQDRSRFESPLLSWLGPWQVDAFAGQLEGHAQPVRPWLIGMRLQFEPIDGLQIGLSRAIQWGGRGRPHSLRSLFDALVGRDNTEPGDGGSTEPGNQLGGFDVRYEHAAGPASRVSAYVQGIGEDEAGLLPSAFLGLIGADWSVRRPGYDWRVYAEWADTIAGDIVGRAQPAAAYRHHIYVQGYANDSRPLGYPVGGDVRIGTLGVIVTTGPLSASLSLHQGRAGAAAQLYPAKAKLTGAEGAVSARLSAQDHVGLSLWAWRIGGERHGNVQVWWRHAWH